VAVGFLLLARLATAADATADQAGGDAPVATGSGPLGITIAAETLQTETGPDGAELRVWIPAGRLSAGDDVYYTIRVHNPGKEPVNDVVVTKRLPFGVHYKAGSAVGPACSVQFSVDGGATFTTDVRPGRTGTNKARRKPEAVDYTHVRWILSRPLVPGATALLRFRASFS
jgi:uncharacterized repeat protein (TIGR01451 family)